MCAANLLNRWLHGDASSQDPEMVQATLEQIQPFTLNPRVTRNPGYDILKASIRARGLDNPPVLTRRPGEQQYTLAPRHPQRTVAGNQGGAFSSILLAISTLAGRGITGTGRAPVPDRPSGGKRSA